MFYVLFHLFFIENLFYFFFFPQFLRYKNDKEISPNDKAKSKKMEDCKFQLEIPDAKKEDTANYKVKFQFSV